LGSANDGVVVTRFEYDRKNRQTFLIHDDLDTTQTLYDGADRMIEQVDPGDNRVEYSYNDQDNVVKTVQQELTQRDDVRAGKVPDLTETFLVINVYDSLDRLIRATNNLGQTRRNHYDSRDNVIMTSDAQSSANANDLIADPLGLYPGSVGVAVPGRPPDGSSETNAGDHGGSPLQASRINRPGNTMAYFYDGINRRITEVRDLRRNGQGGQQLDTSNAANRDARSRMVSRVDDNGNTTRYQYDDLNRQVREVFADGTMNIHTYDADNHRLQTTDENRSVIARQYDGISRPTGLNITRGSGVVGTTQQLFQYDGLSRLTRAVDNNEPGDATDDAVVTLAYDSLNRRLEEVQNGQAISSRWDGDNNRVGLVYANGRELEFAFDHLDRIDRISGQRSAVGGQQMIADYTYIGSSRVLERSYANGARLTYLDDMRQRDIGYDGLKRVVNLRHLRGDSSLIAGFGYGYDRQNNKLSEQRLDQPNVSERYSYDSLYRLVQSTPGAGASDTFQLDGVGNWMRRNQTANQVGQMNEYEQFASVAQRHDDNGNVTDDGRNRYEYDALNRLRRVTRKSDNAVIAVYRYDAFNRRVERIVTNSGALNERVQYSYDGWREIEERRGNAVQQYVYGMWIDEPLTLDKDDNNDGVVDQTFYYHQDGKTNVTALTNTSGGLVQSITYDAYGRPSFGQNTVANPYLFAGRRYDPETGLYYFRARFYDPARGRFLQRDPIGLWTDKTNLGNGYTYVGNNPLNWTDPLGLRIRIVKGGCSAWCGEGTYPCCSSVIGCNCYDATTWFDAVERGFCDPDTLSSGASNSCVTATDIYESALHLQFQPTCAYSPVLSVGCLGGGMLDRAPDGQVAQLTPIHLPIKEWPPLSAFPPPPPPQGPGSSRCGSRKPNTGGGVNDYACDSDGICFGNGRGCLSMKIDFVCAEGTYMDLPDGGCMCTTWKPPSWVVAGTTMPSLTHGAATRR
jgi:RHS repeat-associated protein